MSAHGPRAAAAGSGGGLPRPDSSRSSRCRAREPRGGPRGKSGAHTPSLPLPLAGESDGRAAEGRASQCAQGVLMGRTDPLELWRVACELGGFVPQGAWGTPLKEAFSSLPFKS